MEIVDAFGRMGDTSAGKRGLFAANREDIQGSEVGDCAGEVSDVGVKTEISDGSASMEEIKDGAQDGDARMVLIAAK